MKLPPRKPRTFEIRRAASTLTPENVLGASHTEANSLVQSNGALESRSVAVADQDSKAIAQQKVADDLVQILGVGKVSIEEAVITEHAGDKWFAKQAPDVVVFAENTDDVSKTLAYAHKNHIPVTTRGAGIGYVGGCVPVFGGIVLSTARMKKILEISPHDGVAVVQPGVVTGDLQKAVRALGWDYPPDPASLKECTIGGNVATNAGGPRCLKYGVTRNYILGLEVVLADGRVMRCGGWTHKNKTGFDLIGLFVGSEGMLGVVTEVTVRIIPKPKCRGMLAAVFPDFPSAAKAVHTIFQAGHMPSALEITDGFTLEAARQKLGRDVFPPGDGHLIVEIDGREAAVDSEMDELYELLLKCGADEILIAREEVECEAIWQMRREFSYSLRDTGLIKLNEDIVVPRGKLIQLVNFARVMEQETGIAVACFGHAGDGNIHTNLMVENYDEPETRARVDAALDILFHWVLDNGGAITGEHGVGLAKKPWIRQALGETSFSIHHSLKKSLDPHGILNPGKFLDD